MVYIIVVVGVMVVLTTVTVVKMLGVKNQADFMVAGRKLPWHVLVFTLLTSWIGAGSLFAGGENAYKNGFAAIWMPAGGWVGLIIIFFIAGRARRAAQFTLPDLLETRYNVVARALGTIAIVVSYLVITSYQLKAGGNILHIIFPGLAADTGLYIIAAFVILFTASAGMSSVAYLDRVIGITMTTVIIISVPWLVHNLGGWTAVRSALPASHFTLMGTINLRQAFGWLLPTMLLLLGDQKMYQKFFSARSEKDARIAVGGWIIGTLILETLIIAVAVIGSAKFHPDEAFNIIPESARQGLPTVLGALLLGAIMGQLISTANNHLFSPATNLIHDVYSRFINRNASDRKKLIISRIIVIVLGVFAVLQATAFQSILGASLYAYTIYGASLTPVVLAVFFWKRATAAGAVTAIGLGTLVTVIWNVTGSPYGIDAIFPALVISIVSLIGVSLLTPAPPKEQWAPFFEEAAEARAAKARA
jgi:SSS family solute:Na+ symporter